MSRSIIMSSRKIEDLTDSMQKKYWAFKKKMDDAKIPFLVTATSRLVKEQIALYSQGREVLDYVNMLRQSAGMPFITAEQNVKVTWTLKSRHLIDLDDDILANDKSEAFDIVIEKEGKPTWDIKVNVNKNDIPDYEEAARIGESVGLVAGARFKNRKGEPQPDYPHFQND
jgi:hypothetical protein